MAKRRAATEGQLSDVHRMFTEFLTHRLRETDPNRVFTEDEMEYNDETGEYEKPFIFPMNTAEMGVIAKFLKDNDITCEPNDESLSDLKDEFAGEFKEKREKAAQSLLELSVEETEQAGWL